MHRRYLSTSQGLGTRQSEFIHHVPSQSTHRHVHGRHSREKVSSIDVVKSSSAQSDRTKHATTARQPDEDQQTSRIHPDLAETQSTMSIVSESTIAKPLTHLTSTGAAHMVNITQKQATARSATAIATLLFSSFDTYKALNSTINRKGDAIAVARVAGIQAAKKTADLIPLAHPGLGLTGVQIDIEPIPPKSSRIEGDPVGQKEFSYPSSDDADLYGFVQIRATASCFDKTGVEMEALTAATVTALTMFDMLKGIDKTMEIQQARVIAKSGGKSGNWTYNQQQKRIIRIEKPNDPSALSDIPTFYSTNPSQENSPPNSETYLQKLYTERTKLQYSFEKLRIEREKIAQEWANIELQHKKSSWREERIRHEREKLKFRIEELEALKDEIYVERRRSEISAIEIGKEIEKGISEARAERERKDGKEKWIEKERDDVGSLKESTTLNHARSVDARAFANRRVERYEEWGKQH